LVLNLLTITALIHAAVHWGFFFYLDGRVLSNDPELSIKRTTIPQGYVTTISFLLATAFRAALVASVGVCYTQYLWATLRERVLKVLFATCSPLSPSGPTNVGQVGLVEDLFQIQTNAFHLKRPHLYLETPVLAAIAVFCWLVPIATVYPPGALIVELENLALNTRFNVSVLHVDDPFNDINYTAQIWCYFTERTSGPINLVDHISQLSNSTFLKSCSSRM
jgi:hypothetical protein